MTRISVLKLLRQAIGIVWSVSTLAGQSPSFKQDVLPIFSAHCFSCHGGTSMAGLDLRTASSVLLGSHQGPVVVKGFPDESLLYRKISTRVMPPEAFNLALTDSQIEIIRKWIKLGAPHEEGGLRYTKEQTERFEKEALPIFKARCFSCHGSQSPMGSLDLRTLASVLKGSENGPVVVEGAADQSILIRKVENGAMPPPGMGQPLDDQEARILRNWIDSSNFGIARPTTRRETFTVAESPPITEKDRQFWAFQKPIALKEPKVKNRKRVRTPVDAFVLAKLESNGLTFSRDAPKLTLMRRAYFDLIGLPPTLEEINEFLSDTKSGAYERLVDRLLDSPHYGERWARHWLDVAGYTDAKGFDNDLPLLLLFEGMWRYRDYVVKSFNDDKPYDRFLTEQLAGDELVDWRSAKKYTASILESLIATGYLRCVFDRTESDITNLLKERYDVLIDLVEKVSTGLVGLTVACARCHSHKFDPISQRDYYRFLSVFTPAYNPSNWKQPKNRYLASVSESERKAIESHNAEIDRPQNKLKEELSSLYGPYKERLLQGKLLDLPEVIRDETKTALQTPEKERDEVQTFLVEKFKDVLQVKTKDVDKVLSEEDKVEAEKIQRQIKTLEGYRRSFENIQALYDVGLPPTMRLLQRGDVESPGPKVEAGFLTVLSAHKKSDIVTPPDIQGKTSGYRLAFAHWLTSSDHPLTARVIVNRVWQHYFEKGIVETADNFGKLGSRPTHPELLDWLAVDFMKEGWTFKRLHKLIMTSTVYRQLSNQTDQMSIAKTLDPENRLLWRMNLARLEAEAIRDAVIAASGKLDRTLGGPPILLKVHPDGLQTVPREDSKPNGEWRRSLYILSRRFYPLNFLETFDSPIMQINCNRRVNSVTPLQSLALMNNDFMVENATHLANWVDQMAEQKGADKRIELSYLLTLSRKPNSKEIELAKAHLKKQERIHLFANASSEKASLAALASLCHMLYASNEFLYVD